jgi:uncharacterized protein (TIGR03437 family)
MTTCLVRYCAVAALVCIPSYAGFQMQALLQVSAPEPGQQVVALQVDSQSNMIVIATVTQPTPPGNELGLSYALVKKIAPNGNEIFSQLLPGTFATALVIDGNNDIYVGGGGATQLASPFTTVLATGGFVTKLSGSDGTVVYATELWGPPAGIAVDNNGQAVIALNANSDPEYAPVSTTAGAYASPGPGEFTFQTYFVRLSAGGDQVVFVARYGGAVGFGGGIATTSGVQVFLDATSNIWIVGYTNATDLPVTGNALVGQCGCSQLGFLAEFSSDGSRLLYATYFGASAATSSSLAGVTLVKSAAIDSGGHIWMAGYTSRTDFPLTASAIQKKLEDVQSGFIAEYDPASTQLLYATYFGSDSTDLILQVQTGANGTVAFAGIADATSLPVAATGFTNGSWFLATIDPQTYSIALTRFPDGGIGSGLAITPPGSVVVSGTANVLAIVEVNAGGSSAATPSIYGIANAAGGPVTGQVAPMELVTLYGANIGPATPVSADLSSGSAPTQLGGVQVFVNGSPIPLLYAQSDQVNAILPANFDIPIQVTLQTAGASSNQAVLGLIQAAPEAFQGSTPSLAAALNQDGTVNNSSNPAQAGTIVAVFATGLGLLSPAIPVLVYAMGGTPAAFTTAALEVTYAGQAPALVAGVTQINFRLPAVLTNNQTLFQFDVGGSLSPVFQLALNP